MFGIGRSALDKGLDAFAAKRWRNARQHLEDAANDPHPRAIGDYHLGLLYWRGLGGEKTREGAVACFQRAAESGHTAAQTALGVALLTGAGVQRDPAQAHALFRSAAAAGDAEAMTQLALLTDFKDARALLERAAETGHVPAIRYLSDLIIAAEPVEALAWLYAGAALGADPALSKRAQKLAHEMSADEIAAAQKKGRAILREIKQANR